MQDFYLIVNWAVAIAILSLGFVALLKNRNLLLNRVFALFTLAISVWIVASYISNDVHNSPRVSVVGNYFVFFFSYLAGYLLLWFAVALANNDKAVKRLRKFTLPILLVGLTTGSPLVVAGAKRQGEVYAVEFGPLAILYIIGLILLLTLAMIVLRRGIKRTSNNERLHMVILYKSMAFALPIILVTEFVLPAVTGWFGLTNIGILPMAVPVVGLYYSVVKHRLFDLRLIIVRSLAYVLTMGILSTLYGFASYYLSTIINGARNELIQVTLNTSLIILLIAAYPPLIKSFKRVSNKLFYRDAYDPQELFDHLNKALVSTLDLEKLLTEVADIMITTIKPQYCMFGLSKTSYREQRLINGGQTRIDIDLTRLGKLAAHTGKRVILADYLDGEARTLKSMMDQNDMSMLIRLTPKSLKEGDELGYVFLGAKKSGSSYSNQDLRVMDTVANELVIAIQNALHYEEIQNFNETLQHQVDEATYKLRETNQRLRKLDETKDEFISMASHQLRTPLTSVKGYLSMVLEGDAGNLNKNQRKLLEQSFVSSQRMVYLISDLLNLSRLNTGRFVIEPTPIDLSSVIQDEVNQLAETAKSRELTLTYNRPEHFPMLMLDENKIHQVVMNFLDNAIYYTPSGGSVTVDLYETPTAVIYTVKDTGIGVPRSVQHKLFTKFYRAQNAQQARPDGTGLGLFMAKKVIAAQGGSLIFDSIEGKGSTFGFRFSKARLKVPVDKELADDKTKTAHSGVA